MKDAVRKPRSRRSSGQPFRLRITGLEGSPQEQPLQNGDHQALWEVEEQVTAEAYAHHPDSSDVAFDSAVWEAEASQASDEAG